MKFIPLTKGKSVKVDDEDFDYLNKLKWYYNGGYAVRGCLTRVLMHRVILNAPKNYLVDHINRDKLDNQKSNLRLATRSLNNFNTKIRTDNKSGVKGIFWNKRNKNWRALISKEGKRFEVGSFKLLRDAILAINKATKEIYGL